MHDANVKPIAEWLRDWGNTWALSKTGLKPGQKPGELVRDVVAALADDLEAGEWGYENRNPLADLINRSSLGDPAPPTTAEIDHVMGLVAAADAAASAYEQRRVEEVERLRGALIAILAMPADGNAHAIAKAALEADRG